MFFHFLFILLFSLSGNSWCNTAAPLSRTPTPTPAQASQLVAYLTWTRDCMRALLENAIAVDTVQHLMSDVRSTLPRNMRVELQVEGDVWQRARATIAMIGRRLGQLQGVESTMTPIQVVEKNDTTKTNERPRTIISPRASPIYYLYGHACMGRDPNW